MNTKAVATSPSYIAASTRSTMKEPSAQPRVGWALLDSTPNSQQAASNSTMEVKIVADATKSMQTNIGARPGARASAASPPAPGGRREAAAPQVTSGGSAIAAAVGSTATAPWMLRHPCTRQA